VVSEFEREIMTSLKYTFVMMMIALAAASVHAFQCDSIDLATAEIVPLTIQEIQSNVDMDGSDSMSQNCFPTLIPSDQVVSTSGIVTAAGANKLISANPPVFFIQDGTEPFSGIEVFDETHLDLGLEVGDKVTIIGVVTDTPGFSNSEFGGGGDGITTFESCSIIVESKGNDVPEPVVVSADILNADDCNYEAEQWEAMIVRVEDLEVIPCLNRLNGFEYGQCSANVDTSDESTWDKFYQSWLSPGGSDTIIELENHLFTWVSKCEAVVGDKLEAVQGILTWESQHTPDREGLTSWDITPRDVDDIVGCQPISADVIPQTVVELQQKEFPYGPTEWGSYPPEKLSVDIGGSAEFPGTSCPPPELMLGPNATIPRTHNLCSCFPPKYYDPSAGSQGSGTDYVRTTGIISYLEAGPFGPYYFEGECSPHGSMYVFRQAGSVGLEVGDEIEMVGKPYVYYGLEQLSSILFLDVVSKGNPTCEAVEVTDFSSFGPDKCGCAEEAEAYESRKVTLKNPTVTVVYNDVPNPSPIDEGGCCYSTGYYYQTARCIAENGERFDSCMIEVADADGNTMLVDNKFGGMAEFIQGTGAFFGEGRPLEVGDSFEEITCIIEHFRGAYFENPDGTGLGCGGAYRCHPLGKTALKGATNGVNFDF